MGRILTEKDVEPAVKGGSVYAAGGGGWADHGRMLGYAAVLGLRTTAAESGPAPTGRAFNFGQALVFVGIVASFMALSRGLESYMGAAGAMVGAATTGLVDAHAAAVSMWMWIRVRSFDRAFVRPRCDWEPSPPAPSSPVIDCHQPGSLA